MDQKTSRQERSSNRKEAAANDDIVDIGSLIGSLWRGKILIAFVVMIFATLGVYYAYFVATPTYRATAVLMLESREEQVLDLESVMSGLSADTSIVNTEVEVLRSRSLLKKVVRALDLTQDPEFNSLLGSPSQVSEVKSGLKDLLGLPDRPQAAVEIDQDDRTLENTVDSLLGSLDVRNVPQSLVFQVAIETSSPRKSADIANALVDLYILNQLEVKFEATEKATTWLTNRVSELQIALEAAEADLKTFRSEIELVNADALIGLEVQLKGVRDRVTGLEVDLVTAQSQLERLEAAQTRQEQAAAAGDTQLNQLLPRIGTATIAQAFDTTFQRVLARARLQVSRVNTQLTALRSSQIDLEMQIEQQSTDLIELQQRTREVEASRLLYEYFLSRLKETAAQQGIQQADSRMISAAVVPLRPSAPNKRLTVLLNMIIGFIIGAVIVLFRDNRVNSFRTGEDLETTTGYPVMGQIPLLPVRRRKDAITYLSEKPTSVGAEAVRNLRTSILLSQNNAPPQTIMISSSLPGEGKTNTALALSQNLSAMGKKVLTIEGDIRRNVMRTYLKDTRDAGLVSVLKGSSTLADTVVHDDVVGCDILLGEVSSENAADLFSSDGFKAVLDEARSLYDHVIIDTPPVLLLPDARIIRPLVDASILVVKWDSTTPQQVSEALNMFESINQKVSGLVLNQINHRGMARYGYGGQYGAYRAYGSKYYNN